MLACAGNTTAFQAKSTTGLQCWTYLKRNWYPSDKASTGPMQDSGRILGPALDFRTTPQAKVRRLYVLGSVSFSMNFTSNVALASPFSQPGGGPALIAARTIDPNFKSARVLSYNLNIQHEVEGTIFQIAYVGSQGRHLRIFGDYNQGINGFRP